MCSCLPPRDRQEGGGVEIDFNQRIIIKVKNSLVRVVSRGGSLLLSHPARQAQIPSSLGSFLVNWATSHPGAGTTSYTYYEPRLEVIATHLEEIVLFNATSSRY